MLLSSIFLIFGYLYYLKSMSKLNYTSLSVLIAWVFPIIITAIISKLILHEEFNLGMFTGFLLTIIGITIFVLCCK